MPRFSIKNLFRFGNLFGGRTARPASRPAAPGARLGTEVLETRDVPAAFLTGDVLRVYGTEAADTINVRLLSNSVLWVEGMGIWEGSTQAGGVYASRVNQIEVYGGGGNDVISTQGIYGEAISIHGQGGEDTIHGSEGGDTITGGIGGDRIYGWGGNDYIRGDEENDFLAGGAGEDILDTGSGYNQAYGEGENDVIYGGDTIDPFGRQVEFLDGGTGDDHIYGRGGSDRLIGNIGADELQGGSENDVMTGEDGDDTIYGQGGDDYLAGGADNDYLSGDGIGAMWGVDILDGGAGNDVFTFNLFEGTDTVYDGAGIDTLDFSNITASGVAVSLQADIQTVANGLTLYLWDRHLIERVIGSQANDVITGNALNNELHGLGGNDILKGEGGNDTLYGGDGNDRLNGVAGEDILDGDDGDDTLDLLIDFDTLANNPGRFPLPPDEYLRAGAGTDTLNLAVDLGGFGRRVVEPFVSALQQQTRKLQPALNFLDREVPFVSKFKSGITFGSLLGGDVQRYAAALKTLNALDSHAVFTAGPVAIGSVRLSAGGLIDAIAPAVRLPALDAHPLIQRLRSVGLELPALTDLTALAKIALGRTIDLVRVRLPEVNVNLNRTLWEQRIPVGVFGLMAEARLQGMLNFSAGGTLGYDTHGLRIGNAVEGFYAEGLRASAAVGLAVEGGVSGADVISGGVRGEVTLGVSLALTDGNDGRVRLSEVGSQLRLAADVSVKYRVSLYLTYWSGLEARFNGLNPLDWKFSVTKKTNTWVLGSGTLDIL